MTSQKARYPGAQPFSDDDFSRRVFFGRETASTLCADKVLANRIVVVYARSGLGKTSLLKAGVAPRLREEGYMPIFVRLNDVESGPLRSVLEAMPEEAKRQGYEFVPGPSDSLWHVFKTAEFWRDDLLLTPVLILDQFEELFTLHSEPARVAFLDQLSYLVRGIRPPESTSSPADELTEVPPSVRIVLSLREDYLGYLEDAADHIPQILDARFRLAPLDTEAAKQAILGPAATKDIDVESKPFCLDTDTLDSILDYLSQSRTRAFATPKRYVEPFQLQLICQHLEEIAISRQRTSPDYTTITMADIGGEGALKETIKDFYGDAMRTLANRSERRAARRLCEEYLISPEGRRLSLEENEIDRQLNLKPNTLSRLMERRLLRSDHRSESTYYELSHDSLIEPILAANRKKTLVFNWLGVGFAAILFLISMLTLLVAAVGIAQHEYATDTADAVAQAMGLGLLLIGVGTIAVGSVFWLRRSMRSAYRYRRAQEARLGDTSNDKRYVGSIVAGLAGLLTGATALVVAVIMVFMIAMIWMATFDEGTLSTAKAIELDDYVNSVKEKGIGIDLIASMVASIAMFTLGYRLMRWGVLRLAHQPTHRRRAWPKSDSTIRFVMSASRTVVGLLVSMTYLIGAAIMCSMLMATLQCGYFSPGQFPEWLPSHWFNMITVDCQLGYPNGVEYDLVFDLMAIISAVFVGITSWRRGLASIRHEKGEG